MNRSLPPRPEGILLGDCTTLGQTDASKEGWVVITRGRGGQYWGDKGGGGGVTLPGR